MSDPQTTSGEAASRSWLTDVSRLVVLVAAGVGLGFAWNPESLRSTTTAGPGEPKISYTPFVITLDEARRAWESGEAIFLDARARFTYERGHVPGALATKDHANASLLAQIRRFIGRDSFVVIVADDDRSPLARNIGGQLKMTGHRRVHVLEGGMKAWKQAGLPTADGWDMVDVVGERDG